MNNENFKRLRISSHVFTVFCSDMQQLTIPLFLYLSFKETQRFFPKIVTSLWNERYNNWLQDATVWISNPVSGEQGQSILFTIIKRFSWPICAHKWPQAKWIQSFRRCHYIKSVDLVSYYHNYNENYDIALHSTVLTLTALDYFCINHEKPKGFCTIW